MKSLFKFMVASTLIVGGVLVAGTILTTKKIDEYGDDLQNFLHQSYCGIAALHFGVALFFVCYNTIISVFYEIIDLKNCDFSVYLRYQMNEMEEYR